MAKVQIYSNDITVLNDEFGKLNKQQQQEVLAASDLGKFSDQAQEVFAYLHRKLDEGRTKHSVPAGVIAGIIGNAYVTKHNRRDFNDQYIRKQQYAQNQFIVIGKRDILTVGSTPLLKDSDYATLENGDLEFNIPGKPGQKYTIRKSDGHTMQYIFVNPELAEYIITTSVEQQNPNNTVSAEFVRMLLKLKDQVINFVRGQESVLDNVQPKPKELTVYEKKEWELSVREREIQMLRDTYEFLFDNFGMDDRQKFQYQEMMLNAVRPKDQLQITNAENEAGPIDQIEISAECYRMGYRPNGNDLSMIGKKLKKKYTNKYNRDPPQCQKDVNGKIRWVNFYSRKNLDLMEESIREQCTKKYKKFLLG